MKNHFKIFYNIINYLLKLDNDNLFNYNNDNNIINIINDKLEQIIIYIKNNINIDNNSLIVNKNNNLINNYIIGEINVTENNKYVQIINSYEEYYKNYQSIIKKEYKNKKEIEENIDIEIDNKKIKFNYYYIFNKGSYQIKYIFKKNFTNVCCLIANCLFINNLDFSNFNTSNINNMRCMFIGCSGLKELNLFKRIKFILFYNF